jgi:hypothetical protein
MDTTAPITTNNIPSGWCQVGTFIVQLIATDYADTIFDTPSGVYRTYYTTDGSTPNLSSPYNENTLGDINFLTQITITGQNLFTIKYFSVDNNGNTEAVKTAILSLDNMSPITTVIVVAPDGNNGWYKTNPTIQLTAVDTTSGVLKTFFRWDSNIFQEYVGTFQIPSIGIHSLQYYSIDIAGNSEVVKTHLFNMDDVAPFTEDDAPSGLQKDPVTIHFFTSDDISGVQNTYYTTDGSTPTISSPSGSSFIISESGTYIIKYFSKDFAGNSEIVRQSLVEVFIDTEAPHTYISESFPINGTGGWYRTTPNISLIASDPSGI